MACAIGHRHLLFGEGLTEFFTGYILFKDHRTCYDSWKRGTFRECKLSSYKSKVKLWCTFCNFIELGEVIKLYFWTGSCTWDQHYTRFLTAIHNAGYPDFRDIFNLGNDTEMLFTQECIYISHSDASTLRQADIHHAFAQNEPPTDSESPLHTFE